MSEVLLKIESEGREGVLAVGSYLMDAAARLGMRIEDDPASNGGVHTCGVVVESGSEMLSEMTETERTQFERDGRKPNERLACQVKFVKPGEVVIMVEDKKKAETKKEDEAEQKERFRKEFEEMPLERKISNLLQLEVIALGETVKFVLDSPYKVIDKLMDVMAEFGLKKDEEAKKANRPKEHTAKEGNGAAASGEPDAHAAG
jgi:ferredoxin